MKTRCLFAVWCIVTFLAISACPAYAQLEDVLKNVLGGEEEIIEGLKEALKIGTGNVVELVSKLDGFYKNPDIRILLPEKMQKAEKFLKRAGFGAVVDQLELSMNRAAEQASSEAKDLFWDAIKQMTIKDAEKILKGKDNEATLYFKEKTSDRLQEIFKPIVKTVMSEVGVTKAYQDLTTQIQTVFPLDMFVDVDLEQYVTDKTLDGLFLKLSEEERKIRQDPEARVTELLRRVFKDR